MKINPRINRLIKIIGRECTRSKINAYLVGGPVRDLFLGKSNIDLDIVLDKDVKTVLPSLAKIFSARHIYHPQFKTAKLFLNNLYIDIATMREEIYPSMGSLPQVRISSAIEKDLFRRDFTINAMAIKISKRGLTDLIDPYNGRGDLKSKKIRVLQRKSFLDDPTRIIRAIRFATRFNFSLEKNTLKWLKEAVSKNVFSEISSVRCGNEIIKLLQEREPIKGIKMINHLCGLKFIHPKVRFNKKWEIYFSQIPKLVSDFEKKVSREIESWIIYFVFLTEGLGKNDLQKLCREYEIKKNHRLSILHALNLRGVLKEEGLFRYRYSDLFNILRPIFPESIIYLIICMDDDFLRTKSFEFLIRFYRTKLYTDGERLKEMGFSPGPIFNKILKTLFLAKLDGIVSTQREEEDFIKEKFCYK